MQIVEQVVAALARAKQDEPIAKQTNDRGLFEAIAQIVALRRATAPVAIDILERVVMPAMHVGMPEKFPPLDEDDLANLRKGIELFAFFVEVVPHKFQADDEGFLGTIPHEQLTTPYADRNVLEIGKGDWVVVNPAHFMPMLQRVRPAEAARQVRRVRQVRARRSPTRRAAATTAACSPRPRSARSPISRQCVGDRGAEQGRAAVPPAAAAGLAAAPRLLTRGDARRRDVLEGLRWVSLSRPWTSSGCAIG